jgi:anti-sigma factor RsiW
MRCPNENRETAELLLARASRKLDAQRADVLEEHLAGCPSCREYAAAQIAVWEALDAWEAPPVSADFDRRLHRRIEREGSWRDALLRPFRPLFAHRAVPVAVAAGMLIAAGLWLGRPGIVPAAVSAPQSAEVDALPPDQAARTLQEMQMMQEFGKLVHAGSSAPEM